MERLDDDALNIYTDGSCLPSPRRGGIGFRFVTVGADGHEQLSDHSPNGYKASTNQEMELLACIEALKLASGRHSGLPPISSFRKVVIYTDSKYVAENFETAKFQWSRSRDWQRRSGAPVLNATLWKELVRLARGLGRPLRIEWVRGKKNHHTKAVDRLAKDSAARAFNPPISPATVRRKQTERAVDPGSIALRGQVLDVRIVTAQYLRQQRCTRYRYEVMSEDSEQFGHIDWAVSDEILRGAHTYTVRFNEDQGNPRIIELIGEVAAGDDGESPEA